MNKADYCRVVMFLPQEVYTGGERYHAEVFAYLQRQGLTVVPINLAPPTKSRHGLSLVLDCLLANLRFFYQARQLGVLSNVVFFQDFHLHPRLWLFNLLVRLVSGQLRTVVLMQSALFYHSVLQHQWTRWVDRWAVQIFLRQANLVLTNSEFTRQEVLSLGIHSERVKAVYCGYKAISMETATKTSAVKENKDHKHILFVGQCAEIKGIEPLLQAIPMLSDKQAFLDIVGNTVAEPQYFARLQRVIEELSLHDRVTFHGHISNKAALARLYQQADVFVLPSLIEGFGIVLLEAMSFGLPIVASKVGAIPELVKDGENGILVPPADPLALASAIQGLWDSPILRERYGQAGYEFMAAHHAFYSWEAVGERVFQAMQPILKETYL